MAANLILGTGGLIQGSQIDLTSAPFSNYVTNPMTANLSGANTHNITDCAKLSASLVETDQLKTIQGSLQLAVQVGSDMEFADGLSLRFNGDAKITSDQDFILETLPVAPSSFPNVIGYDVSTGKCYSQAAGGGGGGTVTSVSAGSNISVTGTSTAPVVNLAISGNVDMSGNQITGLSSIGLNAGSRDINGVSYIRNDNLNDLNFLIGGGTNPSMKFLGNGDALVAYFTDFEKAFRFTNLPICANVPDASGQLVNKTYVDGQIQLKPSSVFYVSKQGSDTNNGSILKPFLTIQAAITAAEAVSSSANPTTINVAIGTYAENITFSKGYVSVCGTALNQYANITLPRINGSITVNVGTSDDLYGRVVALQGLLINGSISDTSAYQHTLSIKNCYINGTSSARAINVTNSATDQRTYVFNTQIENNSNFPAIECGTGWLNMQICDVTQNNNQPVVSIQSAGLLVQMLGCILQATHTGSQPICVIIPTSGTHTISNSSFIYTNATGKVDGTSNGVQLATPNVLQLTFCYFILTGTSTGSGLAVGGSGTVVRGSSVGLYGHKITGPTSIALSAVS
jgi:hypothetical protein